MNIQAYSEKESKKNAKSISGEFGPPIALSVAFMQTVNFGSLLR